MFLCHRGHSPEYEGFRIKEIIFIAVNLGIIISDHLLTKDIFDGTINLYIVFLTLANPNR